MASSPVQDPLHLLKAAISLREKVSELSMRSTLINSSLESRDAAFQKGNLEADPCIEKAIFILDSIIQSQAHSFIDEVRFTASQITGFTVPNEILSGNSEYEIACSLLEYMNSYSQNILGYFMSLVSDTQNVEEIRRAAFIAQETAKAQIDEVAHMRFELINSIQKQKDSLKFRVPEEKNEEKAFVKENEMEHPVVRFGPFNAEEVPIATGTVVRVEDDEYELPKSIADAMPVFSYAPLLFIHHPNLISVKKISKNEEGKFVLHLPKGVEFLPRVRSAPVFDEHERVSMPIKHEDTIRFDILSLLYTLTEHATTFEWLSLTDFSLIGKKKIALRNFSRSICGSFFHGEDSSVLTVTDEDFRRVISSRNKIDSDFREFLAKLAGGSYSFELSPLIERVLPSSIHARNLFFAMMLIEQLRRPNIDLAVYDSLIRNGRNSGEKSLIQIVDSFETVPEAIKVKLAKMGFDSMSFAALKEAYSLSGELYSPFADGVDPLESNCGEIVDILVLLSMMISVDVGLDMIQYFALADFIHLHAEKVVGEYSPKEFEKLKDVVKFYSAHSPFYDRSGHGKICTDLDPKVGAFLILGIKAVLDVFGYNEDVYTWISPLCKFFCVTMESLTHALSSLMEQSDNDLMLFRAPFYHRITTEGHRIEAIEESTQCSSFKDYTPEISQTTIPFIPEYQRRTQGGRKTPFIDVMMKTVQRLKVSNSMDDHE